MKGERVRERETRGLKEREGERCKRGRGVLHLKGGVCDVVDDVEVALIAVVPATHHVA
jgi:hypothetical protein